MTWLILYIVVGLITAGYFNSVVKPDVRQKMHAPAGYEPMLDSALNFCILIVILAWPGFVLAHLFGALSDLLAFLKEDK